MKAHPAFLLLSLFLAGLPAHALNYSFTRGLKEVERPDGLAFNSMGPDHPAAQALETDHINLRKLHFLLPMKFMVASGEKALPLADQAVLQILKTETGQTQLCRFSTGTEQDLVSFLGISAKAAHSIVETCKSVHVPEGFHERLKVVKDRMTLADTKQRLQPKRFFFLISKSARSPKIEAYTTPDNRSYVVLSRSFSEEAHLIRAVAHELAISYDMLSQLGYIPQERQGSSPPPKFIAELESSQLLCALRDPVIRYAASTQRAFRFEDKVIRELGMGDISPLIATRGTCREILAKNSFRFREMAAVIAPESEWYERSCGQLETEPEGRVQQFRENIEKIEKVTEKIHFGSAELDLCSFIMEPHIGPAIPDKFPGGPRPRMGGWEPTQYSGAAGISKILSGERLTPEDTADLGRALTFPEAEISSEGKAGINPGAGGPGRSVPHPK